MAPRPTVLAARFLLAAPDRRVEGGGLVLRQGQIQRVLGSPRAVARAARELGVAPVDLGDAVLTAGLVDAHAHLELSGLGGRLPRDAGFAGWVAALIAQRGAASADDVAAAVKDGAWRLLRSGTTSVGDIDSLGIAERALAHCPLRVRLYREVLDVGDAERRRAALTSLARPFARRERLAPGLSPHAPYTVSAALFEDLAPYARRPSWAVTVHWAETEDEARWIATGDGPLAELVPAARAVFAADPLEAMERAGLLTPRASVVHANHPRAGDVERLARTGVTVVHCPGTHAFFDRAPFDLARWHAAGVPVALGTDSLASNDELSLLRELALLRASASWLAPAAAWEMATVAGARALGYAGRLGVLAPGARADVVAFETGALDAAGELEALTSDGARVVGVWVGGRRVVQP